MKALKECPICGELISNIIRDTKGESRMMYFHCVCCSTTFYPGWHESAWPDSFARPIPMEIADFSEEEADETIVLRVRQKWPKTFGVIIAVVLCAAIGCFLIHTKRVVDYSRTMTGSAAILSRARRGSDAEECGNSIVAGSWPFSHS